MIKKISLVVIASAMYFGCRPEPEAIDLADQLVVATNYDPAANFSAYSTYAIPSDTIGFISNNSNDTIIVASESDFPRPVLQALNQNLSARGYTKVARNADPDLGINVIVVNDFDVFQNVVYPDYYYPGNYYSGYYGYGSWYYYPYVETYAYNTGVLIVEIVDLKNKTPDNKVRVVWNSYMGDVYSTVNLIDQAVDAIHQSFAQSPYLTK